MNQQQIILATLLVIFAIVGGMVDTYASHRFFPPQIKPPKWLSDFFLVWWLVIFVILLPMSIAFAASGFKFWVIKTFLVFGVLASVFWDLVFSKIWSGKWISDSCKTWFWVGKFNLGFNSKQIVWWHLFRLILFLLLIYVFYIRSQ